MTSPKRPMFGPVVGNGKVEFRLWAPGADIVSLEIEGQNRPLPLERREGGWQAAVVPGGAGMRYRFRLPEGALVPDPASRYQPDGIGGPSEVVGPGAYRWRNADWRGRPWEEAVVYELHAGIFGGYDGIRAELPTLAKLGITAIELMPIAEFPGDRNWGYDGVLPFAPTRAYGTPDALKAMIDAAHGQGIMVFLDVVYNHFGPEGNWLHSYAQQFFREDRHTPWGAAIDFRRPEVRRFFIENALYWLEEFRFDGLRLDAVHAISDPGWIDEMAAEVRAAFPSRHVHLILENELNAAEHLRQGVTAQWNDDFHNTMHVILTGETVSYYRDFAEDPIGRLACSLAEGFVYQGQPAGIWGGKPRGSKSGDLPPTSFVNFLQNHDQVGNRALGERLIALTHPENLKAAMALLLLSPFVPMLFMGEECGARSPFLFFTDFTGDLAKAVREGRRREFAAFPAFADAAKRRAIPNPNAPSTFLASRFDRGAAEAASWRDLCRALLALRRTEIVPRLKGMMSEGASVIGSKAVLARWRAKDDSVLAVAVNFGGRAVRTALPAGLRIWGDAEDGRLPARSASAWIAEPGAPQ